MGKVFNDEIIKILCAKNVNKIQNEVGEPNLKEKCSCLRRGESYVVYLDRDHRKKLQRQMGGMDLKPAAAEKSLCTIGPTTSNIVDSRNKNKSGGLNDTWLKRTLSLRRRAASNAETFKAQIYESLCSVLPKRVSDMLTPRNVRGENERITPSVLGPFLDEPICGFIDRFVYCICIVLGMDMDEQEPCKE